MQLWTNPQTEQQKGIFNMNSCNLAVHETFLGTESNLPVILQSSECRFSLTVQRCCCDVGHLFSLIKSQPSWGDLIQHTGHILIGNAWGFLSVHILASHLRGQFHTFQCQYEKNIKEIPELCVWETRQQQNNNTVWGSKISLIFRSLMYELL